MQMNMTFQLKKFTRSGPLTAMAVSAMLLVGSVSSADAWHRGVRHGPGILGGAIVGGALGAAIGGKKGILPGAVIGGAVGAATTPRHATPPPPPRHASPPPPPRPYYPPRPVYDRNLVYNIQVSLLRLGYDPGPLDGAYGQLTANAISRYESDKQIVVTGLPSQGLYYHLQQAGG
jgi:Putative peptidoglycan binding domain